MIDPAMCRPGRLDKLLYVDLPGADERVDILRTMARKVPLAPGTLQAVHGTLGSVEQLVKDSCEGFSGADLAALIREAGVIALRTRLGVFDYQPDHGQEEEPLLVTLENFQKALEKVWPSVSVAQRRKYETLRSKFAGMPVRGRPTRVTDDDPKGDGHPSLAV